MTPPPELVTHNQFPLLRLYEPLLDHCAIPIREKLAPTINDIAVLHNWMFGEVKRQFGISPRKPDLNVEAAINRHLLEPISLQSESDPAFISRREITAEYIHTTRVLETTLRLKRFMFEKNLPEKVFAYQTGTGFPLPEEMEGCRRLDYYLPYGEDILSYVPKPAVSGHSDTTEAGVKKGDSPGMYFYEITSENGEKATLIVLKGRKHAYELLGTPRPHHTLALLPRVLKGIGVRSLLNSFATGFDGVPYKNELPPNVGDFGYIMANQDLTGVLALTHPGIGSQAILSQFGGPFQAGITRTSARDLITVFQDAFDSNIAGLIEERGDQETYDENSMFYNEIPLPRTHYAIEYDCPGVVVFENEPDWAAARARTELVRAQPDMIDAGVLNRTNGKQVISVQGMAVAAELENYHAVNILGLPTIFNRDLPTLAIAGATDLVDPRTGGQSHHISHQEVQKAGERSKAFIAPVISHYFISLAGK